MRGIHEDKNKRDAHRGCVGASCGAPLEPCKAPGYFQAAVKAPVPARPVGHAFQVQGNRHGAPGKGRAMPGSDEPFQLHRFKDCGSDPVSQALQHRVHLRWLRGKGLAHAGYRLHSHEEVRHGHGAGAGHAVRGAEPEKLRAPLPGGQLQL